MNNVQVYQFSLAVSQTSITPTYITKYDQILIDIPGVASTFASSPVAITLQGYANNGGTTKDLHYYDYVTNTPNTCVITVSTKGIYEFPNAGSMNYIGVTFDVAATQAATTYLITPKTTY